MPIDPAFDFEHHHTRVYVSDESYVCIAQDTQGDGTQSIIMAPAQVESVIARLQSAILAARQQIEEEDNTPSAGPDEP